MPSTTQSIEKLKKKLNKDPNSLIFFQLAEEYRKEGKLDDAIQILKNGLTRHPNYWSARVTLGRIYHQQGNEPSARVELEKVVQSVPDNLLANRLLGDIYTAMHLPAEALKSYRMVHMLTPTDQDLIAHIKKLEAEVTPEAEPQQEPVTQVEVETVIETVAPSEESGPAVFSEPQDEGVTPTIQLKVPIFENMEAPVGASELILPEPVQESREAPTFIEEKVSLSPEAEQMEQLILNSMQELEPPIEQELFASDTLIIEGPEVEDEKAVEEPAPSTADSDELTSLASLLLSTEKPSVDQQDFDELEAEIEVEPEFEVEEFLRDPQQDRTQPIEGEEETGGAEELTSETLAELYLSQGFTDKAVKIYQQLLLKDPGNKQILERLHDLNADDSASMQFDGLQKEEVVLVEQHQVEMEPSEIQDSARRDEIRRRKINTLESWLTTIRRERD